MRKERAPFKPEALRKIFPHLFKEEKPIEQNQKSHVRTMPDGIYIVVANGKRITQHYSYADAKRVSDHYNKKVD
tara:strand:+ start:117 stop:338 length:222 start_codon:yes stop_codon:yes gene_type:complete